MKEYKAIRVKWDYNMDQVNQVMNDMAKDGWDVVSVSLDHPNTTNYIVVLKREESHGEE